LIGCRKLRVGDACPFAVDVLVVEYLELRIVS
jgi:hypothetical protein